MDYGAQWFTLFNKKSMQNFNYNQEILHLLQVLMWVANVTTVVWWGGTTQGKTWKLADRNTETIPFQACKKTHFCNEYVKRGKYWISVWGADKSDKQQPYIICDGEKITSLITFEATGKLNTASFYNDLRENHLFFFSPPWLYIAVRERPAERKMEHMIKGSPVSQFTD